MNKSKDRRKPSPTEVAQSLRDRSEIISDILGSYTGISEDGGKPEQDADDL